jgi:hypothetical protein
LYGSGGLRHVSDSEPKSATGRKTPSIEGIALAMALEFGKGFLSVSLLFDLQQQQREIDD